MKKVLALLLALVMITALASCSGGQTDDAAANSDSANTVAPSAAQPANNDSAEPAKDEKPLNPKLFGWQTEWDNYGLPTDPITLTAGIGTADLPDGTGILNSTTLEAVKEATGITLDWIGYDQEKYAVLAAGDDLPDIFLNSTTEDVLRSLILKGAFLDMDPLVEKYGDNIKAVFDDYTFGYSRYFAKESGKEGLYFLPTNITNMGDADIVNENGGGWGLYVRYDIYEAIGTPSVTDANGVFSEDGLINVLKQMQDYTRNDLGVSNAWALTGWNDWGAEWIAMNQYNYIISGTPPKQFYDNFTGEYQKAWHEKDAMIWNYARFYNKAYRAGIFDPEAFILDAATVESRTKFGGEVLAASHSWWFDWDTQPIYFISGMPFYQDVNMLNKSLGSLFANSRSININCKVPERAVAFLDYLASDEFQRSVKIGLKGVEWDYNENGYPMIIGDNLDAYLGVNEEAKELYGVGKKYYTWFPENFHGVSNKICADGFAAGFWVEPYWREIWSGEKPMFEYFKRVNNTSPEIAFPGLLYEKWLAAGAKTNKEPDVSYQFMPARSTEMEDMYTRISTYITDNQSKLILAESDEAFEKQLDEMCATLLTMGSDKLRENEIARMEASKAVVNQMKGK